MLTSAPNAAPYADELAVKGLAPGVPRDVTFKTIWYVVRTWNAVRPVPARVKSGLEQTLNSGVLQRAERCCDGVSSVVRVSAIAAQAVPACEIH